MSGPVILILITLFFISGCFDLSAQDSVQNNLKSQIPRTEFSYRGLVDRSITVQFNVKKSEISEIIASVQLPENYSETLKFKWTLGQDIEIQSGELHGSIENYEKNKTIVLRILVKGFDSKIKRHLRFEIQGVNQGRPLFADGIISSDKENSFEQVVKEIENYKKENSK